MNRNKLESKVLYLYKSLYKKYRNLINYGIIGAISSGLDFMVYTILTGCLTVNYQIINVISIHCGILCSFILNRQYNFRVKDKTVKRFASFYFIGLCGLGLSASMLYFQIDLLHLNAIMSKLITIVFVALIQFILNKTITFKSRPNNI